MHFNIAFATLSFFGLLWVILYLPWVGPAALEQHGFFEMLLRYLSVLFGWVYLIVPVVGIRFILQEKWKDALVLSILLFLASVLLICLMAGGVVY